MGDPHSEMINLVAKLTIKTATGQRLPSVEQTLADIMWIDIMVSPNGFDGWLYDTSCERMRSTLEALNRVGCTCVADIVSRALKVAGVRPESMSDEDRQGVLDSLSDDHRDRLSDLDGEFYEAAEECMAACSAFVRAHDAEFVDASE